MDHPALQKGPERDGKESEWIDQIEDIWQNLRNLKKELSDISLFGEYYNPENARYLGWFISAGGVDNSLEKDLLAAEDIFVLSWKLKFLDFGTIEKKVEDVSINEKPQLIQHCKYMMHLIDMYNKYNFQIHCKDEEFTGEKNKWQLYIQRIEGIIDQKEMKRQQSEKEAEEKKKNMEKQVEREKVLLQVQEEARKNDPFSSQNLYKQEDDPFKDILLLEVVDIYGNLDGEVWSQAPQTNKDEPPPSDDDYYDKLMNDLDLSTLDQDVGSFQLPVPVIKKKL